jgi:ribose transport system substrate-binding protein
MCRWTPQMGAETMRVTKRSLMTGALALSIAALAPVSAAWAQAKGPSGEEPVPSGQIVLTDEEAAKIREGKHTAAMVWHIAQEYTNAVTAGAADEFKRLGIEIVATTEAGFDAAKQKNDLETVLAKNPDIILTLPVDPVTAAEAYRPAIEAGAKLVFVSNTPIGYQHGKDYITLIADDVHAMGKQTANALAKTLGGKGEIAVLFHDAQFYETNGRDIAFEETIKNDYPDIKIVARQGFTDPLRTQEIAEAMLTQNPDLDGFYATFAEPAEGVLAALRGAGNKETKIATLDLSEVVALDMVNDGNVTSITVDMAYEIGRVAAAAAGYGILGKPVPSFLVVPAMTLDKSTVVDGWYESMHLKAPQSVVDAAK